MVCLEDTGAVKIPLNELRQDATAEKEEPRRQFGPSGEWNACICFLLFFSQVYLTYVSIFGRDVYNPFKSYVTNETAVVDALSTDYATSTLSVLFIVGAGIVVGYFVQLLRLPALLGMLVVGIVLRNIPFTGNVMFVAKDWGVVLRRTAFIIILLRGGLSLDAAALRRMKGACLRLAFIPCSVEALSVAVAAKLFFGMDILFGLLLGFVLAAVSPAVVVPCMLEAAREGYGVVKGVPTLVVAAASLDDVYAITLFSLLITMIFSTGTSMAVTLIRAPVEVLSGVFFGGVIGVILRYFPSRDQRNVHLIRLSLLISFSTALLFGTSALGVDSIGAIAVLVSAFVAGHTWKVDGPMPEEDNLAITWHLFFQPVLFGLIGFELSFDIISIQSVALGLLVLLIGLAFRTMAASASVLGCGLTLKERLFVALSWLPKATVQAALAPVALDLARSRSDFGSNVEEWSVLIFAVAVLSILTTAPIGAFVIRLTYPRLLSKTAHPDAQFSEGIL